MNEFTLELKKSNDGQHSIVLWHAGSKNQYVVCSYYNEEKAIGSRWDWGHYFDDICSACDYWREENY